MLRFRPAYKASTRSAIESELSIGYTALHTLALALVLSSRLSIAPVREDGTASCAGFLETVEDDIFEAELKP